MIYHVRDSWILIAERLVDSFLGLSQCDSINLFDDEAHHLGLLILHHLDVGGLLFLEKLLNKSGNV